MSEPKDELARCAVAIAAALAAADPGEKAAARRMDASGAPVFWRQAARLDLPRRQETGWLHFTRMVAILTPASARQTVHDSSRSLGAVLAASGFSERRLACLLAARGTARDEALERAIRMIASARPKLNVVDLALLVFERDRNRLARSYYQHLDHAPTEETPNA